MDLSLEGKIAIVTGGAVGIGKGIAGCLASEGATVIIADLNREEAEKTAAGMGNGSVGMALDVTQKSAVEAFIGTVVEKFGKIDVLVNNAGINLSNNLVDLPEKDWDTIQNVNIKGVYLVTRAAAPHMIARRYGKIINVASFVGKIGLAGISAYCASKFAVIGATQSWAHEFAEYDINVNSVCPGVVRTPLWDNVELPRRAKAQGITEEEAFARVVEPIPLKRPQQPENIGHVVAFLASDISNNITGQAINVTGGQMMAR